MTQDEQTLLIIRGTVASLPKERQERVQNLAATLRGMLDDDEDAQYAFVLVGAEMAAKS